MGVAITLWGRGVLGFWSIGGRREANGNSKSHWAAACVGERGKRGGHLVCQQRVSREFSTVSSC
jgi:hypothetical protein